jgi:hypothetical protein
MIPRMIPSKSIVAVVRIGDDNSVKELLGTGFFVKAELPVLLTAKHAVEGIDFANGEVVGIALLGAPAADGTVDMWRLGTSWFSTNFDIAMFDVADLLKEVPAIEPLPLHGAEVAGNLDVLTWEFSGTTHELREDGIREMLFQPFTRKGNILRYYTSTYPEHHPTRSFDVSFPALQGASGAPVLDGTTFGVAGMLVANHERHLLPAQVVKVDLGDKQYEEIKYFLPVGKAIASEVLIATLEKIGAKPEILP